MILIRDAVGELYIEIYRYYKKDKFEYGTRV